MFGIRYQDFVSLWKMARPVNVLIAICTYGLSVYLSALKSFTFFDSTLFWTEGLILTGIMVGGYWINDIYDYKIDQINKPHKTRVGAFISTKKAMTIYLVWSVAILAGNLLFPFKFWVLNISCMTALYFYAYYFKRKAVIGNLMVAGLTSAVFLAGGMLIHLKLAHLWGMIFSFAITFIREVTKDVEDLRGDLQFGLQTLPIQVGIRMTKQVLAVGYGLLLVACWFPFIFERLKFGFWLWEYALLNTFLVQLPLLFIFIRMMRARRPVEFGQQSRWLKILIGAGLVTILFL